MRVLTAWWSQNGSGAYIWSLTRGRRQEFSTFFFVFEVNPRTDPVLSKWSSLSLPLSFGLSFELPAGSELFYALVVTGRFIRLEICTNQLSFTASCQCVKLSGLLWGAAWGREGGYVKGATAEKRKWVQTDLKRSSILPSPCPCGGAIDFPWCWATACQKWHASFTNLACLLIVF